MPFYMAIWDAAKSCQGIVALNKTFECRSRHDAGSTATKEPQHEYKAGANGDASYQSALNGKPKKRKRVVVDIVAQGGNEWVKVSTVSETRLLFEMAENGWPSDEESDSQTNENHFHDGHEPQQKKDSEDDDEKLSLLRLAEDIHSAACASTKQRNGRPAIRFVLPKLRKGRVGAIDSLLAKISRVGVTVECQPDVEASPAPPLENALPRMMLDEFANFTQTLNIDCTILLALVSDLSHNAIDLEPFFHVAIRRQIEKEQAEQVVPSLLWPAMLDRDLVCTVEAARRMREIVNTIGTQTEKARTVLLMEGVRGRDGDSDDVASRQNPDLRDSNDGSSSSVQGDVIAAFQQYSHYNVPRSWKVPIRIVPATDAASIDIASLPPVAMAVKERLTSINQSVFLYGWVQGMTTLSSNRAAARIIWDTLAEASVDRTATRVGGTGQDMPVSEVDSKAGVDHEVREEQDAATAKEVKGYAAPQDGTTTKPSHAGPRIWLCPTARVLLGKEKSRR